MIYTKTPCVLVMKTDVLIKRAFVSLMSLGDQFEVVVSEAIDISELAADINKTRPDVIFLSVSLPLAQIDCLSRLIIRYPGLKVIVVSEDSNWLHIFKHEDKLLTSLDDLLLIINSE
jgi:DNA-binding NarL/FixJ family response regulator